MVPPAPKRRRPNNDALRKPFKSPFRSPLPAASRSAETVQSLTQNDVSPSHAPGALGSSESVSGPATSQSKLHAVKSQRPLAKRKSDVTLTTQITELQQSINTLEQASTLLSSDK